jgi:hypothetical protein
MDATPQGDLVQGRDATGDLTLQSGQLPMQFNDLIGQRRRRRGIDITVREGVDAGG